MDKEVLLEQLKSHAKEKGFVLNPDPKFLEYLLNSLLRNLDNKGALYCPCRVEQSPEFVCPCASHERDVEETGHCHCHLFFKGDS